MEGIGWDMLCVSSNLWVTIESAVNGDGQIVFCIRQDGFHERQDYCDQELQSRFELATRTQG